MEISLNSLIANSLKLILGLIIAFSIYSSYLIKSNERASDIWGYLLDDLNLQSSNISLLLGSSSIKKLNSANYLHCDSWLNRGIGSATISTAKLYITLTPLNLHPKRIILYFGENDVYEGIPTSQIIEEYKHFISILLERFEYSEIHILPIKPSPKRKNLWNKFEMINVAMLNYATIKNRINFHPVKDNGLTYNQSSFVQDGVHLSHQGYLTFTSEFNKSCKVI